MEGEAVGGEPACTATFKLPGGGGSARLSSPAAPPPAAPGGDWATTAGCCLLSGVADASWPPPLPPRSSDRRISGTSMGVLCGVGAGAMPLSAGVCRPPLLRLGWWMRLLPPATPQACTWQTTGAQHSMEARTAVFPPFGFCCWTHTLKRLSCMHMCRVNHSLPPRAPAFLGTH